MLVEFMFKFKQIILFISLNIFLPCATFATHERLKDLGYMVFPIGSLKIIKLEGEPITYLHRIKYNCDVLVSGTFYGRNFKPVGPFLDSGYLDIPYPKTAPRGFLAIMHDGSLRLSAMNYTNYDYTNPIHRAEVEDRFKSHLDKVEISSRKEILYLMGGGAQIIMPDKRGIGYAVSIESIIEKQFFDQGIGNLDSAQMRPTNHVAIIAIEDKYFAVITPKVSGRRMQRDFLNSNVTSAVKFDGGSGCSTYIKGTSKNMCPSLGFNPSGFCINY